MSMAWGGLVDTWWLWASSKSTGSSRQFSAHALDYLSLSLVYLFHMIQHVLQHVLHLSYLLQRHIYYSIQEDLDHLEVGVPAKKPARIPNRPCESRLYSTTSTWSTKHRMTSSRMNLMWWVLSTLSQWMSSLPQWRQSMCARRKRRCTMPYWWIR